MGIFYSEEKSKLIMNYLQIQFALRGKTLPADHGYALYSALKNLDLKELKTPDNNIPSRTLISSISGVGNKQGIIYLNNNSRLMIRCPAEEAQKWYRYVQNQVLDIRGHLIRLIQPRLTVVKANSTLKARLVTFKLKIDRWHSQNVPVYFLESCQRALDNLGIEADVFIDSNSEGNLAQRAMKIHGKNCLGYGVVVENLSEEEA